MISSTLVLARSCFTGLCDHTHQRNTLFVYAMYMYMYMYLDISAAQLHVHVLRSAGNLAGMVCYNAYTFVVSKHGA